MRSRARGAVLVGSVLVGVAACGFAALMSDHLSRRAIIVVAAGALLFVALLRHPQPRHVLLFGWAASLTYYRTYLFTGFGDFGPNGPYWMRSDLLLAALFLWWAFEAAILMSRAAPRGAPVWPFVAPLLMICLLGTISAENPARAFTDLARILKLALVAWYVRRNVRQPELWWSLAGIATAVIFQSAVSVIQVTTGKLAPGGLDAGGFLRGTGTMVHPNVLAPYCLLVTPVFMALAFRASNRRMRVFSAVAGSAGIVAVICTMSRAPWLLMAAEAVGVLFTMVWLRYIRMERAAGLLVGAALLCSLAALPFVAKLEERFLGNLTESIEFREALNGASWRMFLDHPVLGVGLNHFDVSLPAYDHSFDDEIAAMDAAVEVDERPMVAVHNYFLLILAETGVFGFGSMLLLMGWSLWVGVRAIRQTSGDLQAASIGMFIGIAGLLIEEVGDFSLWMDPALFTFILLAGFLNAAPSIESQTRYLGSSGELPVREGLIE